jgi:hypothetical protein
VRRTLALAALVGLGIALAMLIEPPVRPAGSDQVRGPRVLGPTSRIEAVALTVRTHRLTARRTSEGWEADGTQAPPALADALDTLVETVGGLRALDAFRATDLTEFGLAPPHGTLVVETARGTRRLRLGTPTASGAALYVAREGHPRVFVVGIYLVSVVDRVLAQRDAAAARTGA